MATKELEAIEYTAGMAEVIAYFRRVVEESVPRLLALTEVDAGSVRDGGGGHLSGRV